MDRWQRIEHAFHHARELKGADRARFLTDHCGSDDAMRRQIEALLAQDAAPDSFLNSAAPETVPAGQRIGVYEVLEPLGAGEMGEVYQSTNAILKRQVAIKCSPNRWRRIPSASHVFRAKPKFWRC